MKYTCIECDYITDDLSNLNKHNKTKKHLLKTGQVIKEVQEYICELCDQHFSTKGNLKKHAGRCKVSKTNVNLATTYNLLKRQLETKRMLEKKEYEKKLEEERKEKREYAKKLEEKDKEMVEILKKQIESKDKQLEMNAKLLETKDKIIETQINKSDGKADPIIRGGLAFCRKNFPDALPLETIDFDEAFPKDDKFEDWLLYRHKEKQLPAFFGDGISAVYLEADTGERSLWCSDISRLSYIIRETGARKPKWITDADGNKLKIMVIAPVLSETKKIIIEFSKNIKLEDYDNNLVKISEIKNKCLELCKYLDSIELPKAILRHIAPKFKLDMSIDDESNDEA